MKNFVIVVTLLCIISGLSSCRIADQDPRSKFYSDFSLVTFIEMNEEYLIPGSSPLSGIEAGPSVPPYQKHEEAILHIETSNVSKFMEALKTNIRQAIIDSGARIDGQGGSFQDPVVGQTDIDSISYRYSQEEAKGIINLYGVRGEGTSYIIIVLLTEN